MRILLLHHEDEFSRFAGEPWDLVIDLARAPASSYMEWSRAAHCRVMSLFDFARGTDDLYDLRRLLELGLGRVIDRFGIDWWDVVSLMIAEKLQELALLSRFAATLPDGVEVHTSRPHTLSRALGLLTITTVVNRSGSRVRTLLHQARHYGSSLSRLDLKQVTQVAADKLDLEHTLRRWLARPVASSDHPVVLVPTAYVNVSRTAAKYARMLPDLRFLLVCARNSGVVRVLPENVRMVSLDFFFAAPEDLEIRSLLGDWQRTRVFLAAAAPEFRLADDTGIFDEVPRLIRWGVIVRDAWNRVFNSEMVTSCLCADNSNPYTRIPLILSRLRGIPAFACHHGALDFRMAFKQQYADCYLAKGEMELDYLSRVCKVDREHIVIAPPALENAPKGVEWSEPSRDWLVFFSEPYDAAFWRRRDVYGDLLPRLSSLAHQRGWKLILKLHPFETPKYFRSLIKQLLPALEREQSAILSGPLSPEQWQRVHCAVTVESTMALECTLRSIPVFLLGWMRNPYNGYMRQFERFGVGRVIDSPARIADIPQLLQNYSVPQEIRERLVGNISIEDLHEMLAGARAIGEQAIGNRTYAASAEASGG